MKYLHALLFSLLLCCVSTVRGQVDNYALKLQPSGSVNFNTLIGLNNLSTYTIQFWMNPTEWTTGASLFLRGEGNETFALKLGPANELQLISGSGTVKFSSADLQVGQWSQLTLICQQSELTALVNGKVVLAATQSPAIPASKATFSLGDNFAGRIDEFRLWNCALTDQHNYFINNTLNKHHTQWDNLLVYYKFDQEQCPNIVDYKFNNHGTLSASGASRELVKDNPSFAYRLSSAYTNFARFFDRSIDKDKYLLSNDLIVLEIGTKADGSAFMPYPFDKGVMTNAAYMEEYNGRKGVLKLNGEGAKMDAGTGALLPTDKYSFHTWIYLEKWTEGAYIIKKEVSTEKGFSIRLGAESSKQIIIRIDGREYIHSRKMLVGEWMHFGFSTYNNNDRGELFLLTYNGAGYFPTKFPEKNGTYNLTGLENVPTYIGENLDAKLDETVIWYASKDQIQLEKEMKVVPMPAFGKMVDVAFLWAMNGYWTYDNPAEIGYDSFSYRHFINIMRSAYEGYRGYKIRLGVQSHVGWESTFTDAQKRERLGREIATIANEFDGVDLDFEWTYSTGGWLNYAKVAEQVRAHLLPGKILSVTPHKVAYSFPVEYMKHVDFFLFQLYGPNDKNIFLKEGYKEAYNLFVKHGYPKDKMVLSYATTTTSGMNADDQVIKVGGAVKYPPVGVRNLFDDTYSPELNRLYQPSTDSYRYFTGYDETVFRNQFVQQENLAGIMYWDMGNDVKTSHPYSLVKAANYELNSNIDSLITRVDMNPSAIATPVKTNEKIRVFPNPVTDILYVDFLNQEDEIVHAKVFDMSGRNVLDTLSTNNSIAMNSLISGVYTVRLETRSGHVYKQLVIKK